MVIELIDEFENIKNLKKKKKIQKKI